MTDSELEKCKQVIRNNIAAHGIEIFDFNQGGIDGGRSEMSAAEQEDYAYVQALQDAIPFAIISSNDGEKRLVRNTPWGAIEIHDGANCDFGRVQNVLFGSHIQELKDATISVKYEKYRTDKLRVHRPVARVNSL